MKADIYQAITTRFIEQLKRGTVPWQKPWFAVQNIVSRKPYRGINALLLGSATSQSVLGSLSGKASTLAAMSRRVRRPLRSSTTSFSKRWMPPEIRYGATTEHPSASPSSAGPMSSILTRPRASSRPRSRPARMIFQRTIGPLPSSKKPSFARSITPALPRSTPLATMSTASRRRPLSIARKATITLSFTR